jgi:hypothetical protein
MQLTSIQDGKFLNKEGLETLIRDRVEEKYEFGILVIDSNRTGEEPQDLLTRMYNRVLTNEQKAIFKKVLKEVLVSYDPIQNPVYTSRCLDLAEVTDAIKIRDWLKPWTTDPRLNEIDIPVYGNLRAQFLITYTALQKGENPDFWINIIEKEPKYALQGFTGLRHCDIKKAEEYLPILKKKAESDPLYSGLDIPTLVNGLENQKLREYKNPTTK